MILLVRHGESVLNAAKVRHRREDSPLTREGMAQAARIVVHGAPLVLSSPLLRAYGTACIIAHTHRLPAPTIVPDLTERTWGQTCEDAARLAAHALNEWDGRDVLVVTPAGIIKGLPGLTDTPANGSVTPWQP